MIELLAILAKWDYELDKLVLSHSPCLNSFYERK